MKLINKEFNASYESPTLEWDKDWGCYIDHAPTFLEFHKEDGWEEVKELNEEEKLNHLWLVLLEWEPRDVVDMIIDDYKEEIGYEDTEQ